MKLFALSSLLVSALSLTACDPLVEESSPVMFRPGEGGGGGGVYLNTNAIGANAFSELDLTGAVHNGVRLNEVRLLETLGVYFTLDAVWSEDGELVGEHDGVEYRGADFLGSVWKLTFVTDGVSRPETMWIESLDAEDGHRYTFKYKDPEGVLRYVCEADGDGAHTTLTLPDVSVNPVTGAAAERPDTLYLGCTSGATAKATLWGYAPWEVGVDAFEAAIRVVRADYCGNGVSWTQPGAALQITDVWDINAFSDETLGTEAIWSADGALCLDEARLELYNGAVECDEMQIPVCGNGVTLSDRPGGLFWTKRAPH